MRIQLWSDVHLEFGDLIVTNNNHADVLVLAGDILIANVLAKHGAAASNPDSASFEDEEQLAQRSRIFMENCARQFSEVIAIAGNHEFYTGDWDQTLAILRAEYSAAGIRFLEDESVTIGGVRFMGSTLWTDCNRGNARDGRQIEREVNDYSYITTTSEANAYDAEPHPISIVDMIDRHHQSLYYLTTELAHWTGPTVVVSHHAPSYQSVPPQNRNVCGAYASDLSALIARNPQIQYWVHGHTHAPSDYMVHKTRVVCNPRGYLGVELQANQWDQHRIFEIKN